MKKTLVALSLGTLIGLSPATNAACPKATIRGQFAGNGAIASASFGSPVTIFTLGRFVFDGTGGAKVVNGRAGAFGDNRTFTGNGTYSLNSACVGVVNMKINWNTGGSTNVRLDIIVSGKAADPHINAFYSDRNGFPDTGTIVMERIGI